VADGLDLRPRVLRGRIVFRRNLPEGVPVFHRVGGGRGACIGPGVGVEEVDDGKRYKQSPQPPSSVYSRAFHPGKIIEDLLAPNGVF
jgi:hypothetical protein